MTDEKERLRQILSETDECPSIAELSDGVDNGLPGVEFHLENCVRCAAELAMYRDFLSPKITAEERPAVDWIVARLDPCKQVSKPALSERLPNWFSAWKLGGALAAFAALSMLIGISVNWLNRGPSVVNEDGALRGQSVELVAPRGDVDEVPAELEWAPAPGASTYSIRLLEVDRTLVWEHSVSAPKTPLPGYVRSRILPGKRLMWSVDAKDPNGRVVATGRGDFRLRPNRPR